MSDHRDPTVDELRALVAAARVLEDAAKGLHSTANYLLTGRLNRGEVNPNWLHHARDLDADCRQYESAVARALWPVDPATAHALSRP